ncbi:hypothetical protein V8E51_018302 [Hyaloscypha variabilis]
MIIDSNTFYRITNSVLGSGFSLDVVNTDGPPTGEVDITPSGLFSGQVWQFINPTEPDNGPYYLSSSFLGAEKKLDFSIGADHTYIPLLKNFTATTDQTWIVKKHNDTVSGLNTTTYSIEPNYLNGTQALTANSTTKQPFLAVPGGGYQHWVLTPVMKINDASFSTSALWTMATQTGTATVPSFSGIRPTRPPGFYSKLGQTTPIALPKSALIAIILAPVTLVLALVIFTSIFFYYKRQACKRKTAAALEDKLESPWRDSGQQVYYGTRPPFATAARAYTPSIASSGNFARSTQPEDFNSLDPRPPSRPTSWIRGRDNQPFFGASALGNLDERLRAPQSPTTPPPAELSAVSLRVSTAEIEQMSPRSLLSPVRNNETPKTQRSASGQSIQRSESLISRWKV